MSVEPGSPEWNENLAKLLDKIHHDIENVGWSAISVMRAADDPDDDWVPFTYTIGLLETYKHPELIVYGMHPDIAHGVLSCAIDLIKNGDQFGHGEKRSEVLAQDYDVMFLTHPTTPLNMAKNYYGEDVFDVLQLVWPDAEYKFPGEDGVDPLCTKVQVFNS